MPRFPQQITILNRSGRIGKCSNNFTGDSELYISKYKAESWNVRGCVHNKISWWSHNWSPVDGNKAYARGIPNESSLFWKMYGKLFIRDIEYAATY